MENIFKNKLYINILIYIFEYYHNQIKIINFNITDNIFGFEEIHLLFTFSEKRKNNYKITHNDF